MRETKTYSRAVALLDGLESGRFTVDRLKADAEVVAGWRHSPVVGFLHLLIAAGLSAGVGPLPDTVSVGVADEDERQADSVQGDPGLEDSCDA
jgi:hypothetical protein